MFIPEDVKIEYLINVSRNNKFHGVLLSKFTDWLEENDWYFGGGCCNKSENEIELFGLVNIRDNRIDLPELIKRIEDWFKENDWDFEGMCRYYTEDDRLEADFRYNIK